MFGVVSYNYFNFCCNDLQLIFFIATSVMEQVAAVLDALSDAKETTRQQVIGLVERIALRLEKVESKNQQLVQENELLKNQLNMVSRNAFLTMTSFRVAIIYLHLSYKRNWVDLAYLQYRNFEVFGHNFMKRPIMYYC